MSTITWKPQDIPVTLPEGLTEDKLRAFPHFKNWIDKLTHSLGLQSRATHPFHADPYVLRGVAVQSHDDFGGGRLGFLKLRADVANGAGSALPGGVFLRGPAVAMLVVLVPDDEDGEGDARDPCYGGRHVLLTVQPRVPAASLAFVELPAGMVDDDGAFAGAAAREIREELGLDIPAAQLTCLTDLAAGPPGGAAGPMGEEGGDDGEEEEELARAVYPSAGGCDEFLPIYLHERRVPRAQLGEWTGRLTGLREEGEMITLKLVRMRDLWREGARDAKCLAALALWDGLRREGKLADKL